MEEVRASEVRATLEDLMYVSILEKFLLLGVDMLPRMDGEAEATHAHGPSWHGPHPQHTNTHTYTHTYTMRGVGTLCL